VDVFYLLFPDPWPKRRHHVRRVFTRELLAAVARALVPNGIFRIATDDSPYFEQMQQVIRKASFFEQAADPSGSMPTTTFEKRFTARGLPIYRLLLRKVSEPT
jgi:tRNA (guanine-N7-)-methyltransferase